jgi:hypothetical protein
VVLAEGTAGNVLRGGDKSGSFGTAGTIPITPVELIGISGAVDDAACEEEAGECEVDGLAGRSVVELLVKPALVVALADDFDPNALSKAPPAPSDEGADVEGEAVNKDAAMVSIGWPLGSTKIILEGLLEVSAAR